MALPRESLSVGDPLVLPSGRVLLLVSRTRTVVHGAGGWRAAMVQREPHAMLLQDTDGDLSVLALGPAVVSLDGLRASMPDWDAVMRRLRGCGTRPAPPPGKADDPHRPTPAAAMPSPGASGCGPAIELQE